MSSSTSPWHSYRGTFVHTPSLGSMQILEDHQLVIDHLGFVKYFDRPDNIVIENSILVQEILIPRGSFIIPTFCDLHLHAPQFLYQGNGLDLPLMQWLDRYALKAEELLDSNPILARRVYKQLARRLVTNGTGAVLLFGTIKEETNLILAEEMQNRGVRAFVGKLSMDISSRSTYVESSAVASIKNAKSFVSRCRELAQDLEPSERLVEPVLTPRFVPTCSDELLHGLGQLAEQEYLKVQSHLAEAKDEVEWVRDERAKEDIEVHKSHNLLTPRTIQAHCTFLSPPDLSLIHDYGTSIAHCPLSNVYFSDKPFPLREALNRNVKVGLGTDIAGGYSIDIMNAMRQAVAVSRMREGRRALESDNKEKYRNTDGGNEGKLAIDWKEAIFLATRGGSIGLDLKSGVFEVGAPFDAQLIQLFDLETGSGVGSLDLFFDDIPENLDDALIEKWWCIGDDRNRKAVWIQGKKLTIS